MIFFRGIETLFPAKSIVKFYSTIELLVLLIFYIMTDFSTPRINASMMPSYQGRNVCIVGMAKDIDSNGTSFTLTTSDDKNVRVVMQEPLNEYLAGLTEVHGTIDERNNVQCQNYVSYKPEMSEAFDMSLYNTAVELMARAPQFYIQGVQQG